MTVNKNKRTTPKVGDVHVTSNYRTKGYNKKNNNGRMVVITSKDKDSQTVNAILSKTNKTSKNSIELNNKKNKFLKKKSVVSLTEHTEVYTTSSERKNGSGKKKKVDVRDKAVFSERKATIHWKDKKKIKKALKNKAKKIGPLNEGHPP